MNSLNIISNWQQVNTILKSQN